MKPLTARMAQLLRAAARTGSGDYELLQATTSANARACQGLQRRGLVFAVGGRFILTTSGEQRRLFLIDTFGYAGAIP
jgi:hypothetical protein